MAYDYSEWLARAQAWAETGLADGRLSREQAEALLTIDTRSPESLFTAPVSTAERPLIVAFMGGTGVGKSSLLNRLAGQAIAKAGVERPTSREVTLYHHHALAIRQLPAGLPLHSVKVAEHRDEAKRNIVWIDMPDFDSIETGNKRLVLEWLPHIDVLLYVVSPERYRDHKAWQLLLAEGAKHAWLFVMNQWDRGLAVQYEDFKQTLQRAGFENPLLFRTCCNGDEAVDDEFSELLSRLQQLACQHNVTQLAARTQELRAAHLEQVLQQLRSEIAARDYPQLQTFVAAVWPKTELELRQGLALPLQQLSQFWAAHPGQKSDIKLWDDWAQSRFDDLVDDLILQADALALPCRSLKGGLQAVKAKAEKMVVQSAQSLGRQALLNPGNGLQKFLLKLTSIGETVLPIAAMTAVGYQVFGGYYRGATQDAVYLGADFAIHSLLLIGLSWLIPFFLHKKIQPSLQKAALKGLQKGLQQGLLAIETEIEIVLREEHARHAAVQQALQALLEDCRSASVTPIDKDSLLARALLGET